MSVEAALSPPLPAPAALASAELGTVELPPTERPTVEPCAAESATTELATVEPRARSVRSLAILGDSASVGVGDPLPGGGWRGFGPLLRESFGDPDAVRYTNVSALGARMADVRHRQLPLVLRAAPDVAVLMVGMNDTLRSDFDPIRLSDDCDAVVGSLRAVGATVLVVRFHDHSRVFWLPGPLRRALRARIDQLNTVTDAVVAWHGIGCLDLHTMPGGYDRDAWSVDRLHPSELGHRLLAHNFGVLLMREGFQVSRPVSLARCGGREITTAHRLMWLLFKGVPWLARRGGDLVPYALSILLRDMCRASAGREPHVRAAVIHGRDAGP